MVSVEDLKRMIGPALAAIFLVLATTSTSWWTGEALLLEVKMGLREIGVCVLSQCEWTSIDELHGGKSFKNATWAAYASGWVAAITVFLGSGVRILGGVDAPIVRKIQMGSCAIFGGSSIMAMATFPGASDASFGYGSLMALAAAATGLMVSGRATSPRSGWEGKSEYIPVQSPASSAPSFSQERLNISQKPSAFRTSASMTSDTMERVTERVEFDLDGRSVHFEGGKKSRVAWANLRLLAARRYPPEPPHKGATFFDIVVNGPRPNIIRIEQTTEVNYDSLPGGGGATARENFRKLARFILAQNANIQIESQSTVFFQENKQAIQFIAVKQIAAYEAELS